MELGETEKSCLVQKLQVHQKYGNKIKELSFTRSLVISLFLHYYEELTLVAPGKRCTFT